MGNWYIFRGRQLFKWFCLPSKKGLHFNNMESFPCSPLIRRCLVCRKANKKSVFSLVKMAENIRISSPLQPKYTSVCFVCVIFLDLQGHQLQQDNDSHIHACEKVPRIWPVYLWFFHFLPGLHMALFPALQNTSEVQSNLVISNSLISNYRLSRSENVVPFLTWNYDNR